jgi:hypothetical protein
MKLQVGVDIAVIAGDDIINHEESLQPTTIVTGKVTSQDPLVGAALVITVDGNNFNTRMAADGSYRVAVPTMVLTAAETSQIKVTVVGYDGRGEQGMANASRDYRIDTEIAPPLVELIVDSGSSDRDRITNDGRLIFSGIKEGAEVEISIDGENWMAGFTPVEGYNTLQVRQIDGVGNVSDATHYDFTLDTTAPALPAINALTTNDTTPTISGTATVGSGETLTVTVNDVTYTAGDGNLSYNSTANSWSLTIPEANKLAEGSYEVVATVTDLATNASSDSSSNELVIDTTVAAPTVALASDSGSSNSDKITNLGGLTLGNLETDAKVEYSNNGSDWTTSFTPVEGENSLYVRQTDLAGNISEATQYNFTLDTQAEVSIDVADDRGIRQITLAESQSFTLSGSVSHIEDGNLVSVTFSSGEQQVIATATIIDGSWQVRDVDLSTLNDGELTLSVYATDNAGNTAAATLSDTFSVDKSILTTYFVDNLVNGVTYTTSSGLSGLTGDAGGDGSFNYRMGDEILFSVGDVTVARFSADQIQGEHLFIQDIAGVGLNNVNANYVENIAIFLQALDNDLQDSDPGDGILKTNDIVNIAAMDSVITISQEMRDRFNGYTLDISTADKVLIGEALAHVGIEFSAEGEIDPSGNGKNIFETIAINHVIKGIVDYAESRTPEQFDERLADQIYVPGGVVTYNYLTDVESGQRTITFTTADLLIGAVGQQVLNENLVVENVRLAAAYQDIGELNELGNNRYEIALNPEVTAKELEGLSIDYRVRDWTAFRDVTSATLDTYKTHLSATIADVREDAGDQIFTINSTLVFEHDVVLSVTFTSELHKENIAEYADDFSLPFYYSNDGGETWLNNGLERMEYRADGTAWPIFNIVLKAGTQSVDVKMPIFDDAKIENTEYVEMLLTSDYAYDEFLTFAIIDNDYLNDTPLAKINFIYALEMQGSGTYTVSLDRPSDTVVTIDYAMTALSALPGSDYIDVQGTVVFQPGETIQTLQLTIINDDIEEPMEMAFINLTNPTGNVAFADAQGSLRILDDDGPMKLQVGVDIAVIAGDDIINHEESLQPTTIVTGKVTSQDPLVGAALVITVDGNNFNTRMAADGPDHQRHHADDKRHGDRRQWRNTHRHRQWRHLHRWR